MTIKHHYVGERILLTFWIGSMWTIGFIVAPTLFASLEDRQLAGMLAGKLFTIESYLGLFCAVLLLLSVSLRVERPVRDKRIWALGIMLFIIAVGEFLLQPMMAELKLLGLAEGSQEAERFASLHQLASTLYGINALIGLAYITFESKLD